MPPAAAVHDLLVGEHGRALRTPVHLALLAIRQAALIHAQEEPLVPAVVFREAGGDFGGPIETEAEPLELPLHGGDVRERPFAGRRVVLDRRVLGGQAKGVPAHRMQHVVAAHPHITRQRVADGVVADVPHMQLARGIGQHFEHVVFRLAAGVRLGGVERGIFGPSPLPARLDLGGIVTLLALRLRRGFGRHGDSAFFGVGGD